VTRVSDQHHAATTFEHATKCRRQEVATSRIRNMQTRSVVMLMLMLLLLLLAPAFSMATPQKPLRWTG